LEGGRGSRLWRRGRAVVMTKQRSSRSQRWQKGVTEGKGEREYVTGRQKFILLSRT
jgi:hypothetical protein